ncbi:hypothetical protein B0T20DRAFT_409968 [Sordaria brevicollis]|uniref:Uncharacterized protein n=1 Tax=Sordaria brevicollis TaxID=83679 RepID=A0AAE0UCQ5_SORBR|nr:hypothetical protein B0T20DRAFT_409968 [Sordaria brevicollis]
MAHRQSRGNSSFEGPYGTSQAHDPRYAYQSRPPTRDDGPRTGSRQRPLSPGQFPRDFYDSSGSGRPSTVRGRPGMSDTRGADYVNYGPGHRPRDDAYDRNGHPQDFVYRPARAPSRPRADPEAYDNPPIERPIRPTRGRERSRDEERFGHTVRSPKDESRYNDSGSHRTRESSARQSRQKSASRSRGNSRKRQSERHDTSTRNPRGNKSGSYSSMTWLEAIENLQRSGWMVNKQPEFNFDQWPTDLVLPIPHSPEECIELLDDERKGFQIGYATGVLQLLFHRGKGWHEKLDLERRGVNHLWAYATVWIWVFGENLIHPRLMEAEREVNYLAQGSFNNMLEYKWDSKGHPATISLIAHWEDKARRENWVRSVIDMKTLKRWEGNEESTSQPESSPFSKGLSTAYSDRLSVGGDKNGVLWKEMNKEAWVSQHGEAILTMPITSPQCL